MLTRQILIAVLCSLMSLSAIAQQAIGQWAENLSYRKVFEVTSDGDLAFAASTEGLFSYNLSSGVISRLSKVTGLSDVGIRSLSYSADIGVLVVGYANGNIDLVRGDRIDNISDIKRSTIIGDLGINEILIKGEEAWLSCGFGIVLIDLVNEEVKDTYIIGDLGTNLAVNGVLVEADSVYAATDNGIKVANRNSNLSDFASWMGFNSGLDSNEPYGQIVRFQDHLLTYNIGDSESNAVFSYQENMWDTVPNTVGQQTKLISVTEEEVLIVFRHHFNLRNSELSIISDTWTYSFDNWLDLNSGVIREDNKIFLADDKAGMVLVDQGVTESILPDGPHTDIAWKAAADNGELWVAHGGVDATYNNIFGNNGFSGFDGANWRLKAGASGLEDVRDIVDVKMDPLDENKVYMASFLGGLVAYDKGTDEITVFNVDVGNSPIDFSQTNTDRIQSGSLSFDFNSNLWVTNSYATDGYGWKIMKRDGEWASIGCPNSVLSPNTLYGDMVITEQGQTWTVLPRGKGLVVVQHDNEIITTTNHPCKKLIASVGEGGLPTNTTYSIAEDLDGEIWVGTSEGPVVNYSPQSLFSNNPVDFQPILIERDGNVERLLGSESITAIEVDGANRKWLGTLNGGVFLLSEDGTEEIHHFTQENSPLLSDMIQDIEIDQTTGVVHFITNAGMISYRSDATIGIEKNECYDVYPNPVRPDYYGPIAIDGLKAESEVKITDIAGNIVFQTISNGGRAVWHGTDFSGDRVSTGVYFALVSDRDGESSCVSKILFIN